MIYSGLDTDVSQVLGEYQAHARLHSGYATETWRLTARVSREVAWVEQGHFHRVSGRLQCQLRGFPPPVESRRVRDLRTVAFQPRITVL